jgi:6-pyruvoyltetrahydropterin/6-carboxytetrahydropterin synthase
MDEVVEPVVRRLDHQVLNEIAGLENPTAELLAGWLWRELDGRLPLVELEVSETGDARCLLRRG